MLALFLAVLALAAPDPNREVSVRAGVRFEPGRNNPWAAELGPTLRFAIGDHCSWNEWPDCRSGGPWPIVGPTATVTWSGGTRFGLMLGAVAGVAHVDMYQFGFFPLWEVLGVAGLSVEVRSPAALALGVDAGRSLSYNQRIGASSYRTWGPTPIALRAGALVRLRPGEPIPPPSLRFGLEMCTGASSYY